MKFNNVMQENLLIDLKLDFWYFGAPDNKGAINEYRQNSFFSNYGILASIRIPQMCRTISGRLQDQNFFVHGSIFVHVFCAINLSRKFARHRIMFAINEQQALSHGYSRFHFQKHLGRCQRKSRLEYLRRLCPSANSSGQKFIYQRRFWSATGANRLRLGCNDHRFMFILISLGLFSKEQRCDQTAYAFRPNFDSLRPEF